jgi:hypothetical protein
MSTSETDDIDQKIDSTRIEIANLEATITNLASSGHEVVDATAHFRRKIEILSALMRVKLKPSPSDKSD